MSSVMTNLPASLFCIFIIFLASFPATARISKQPVEHFNRSTGELYWDIDSEVRLKYIHTCRIVRDDSSTLNEIVHELDIFSVLDWDTTQIVSCTNRGLRATYILREDELFPESYNKGIAINNKKLKYYSEGYEIIKDRSDSANYQNIYAALKSQKPIVAAVYANNYFDISTQAHGYRETPEIEVIIDASNLDAADSISEKLAQSEASHHNDKIYRKYWLVIFINTAVLVLIIIGLFLIRRRVWSILKAAYEIASIAKASTKSTIHSLSKIIKPEKSKIIKTDNLKPYSVADELLKWTQLKDAGVVSEEEFREARDKIMSQ